MHTLKVIKYRGELRKPHGPQMSHFVGFAILNTSTARISHFCTYGELMCTELQYCNFAKGFFSSSLDAVRMKNEWKVVCLLLVESFSRKFLEITPEYIYEKNFVLGNNSLFRSTSSFFEMVFWSHNFRYEACFFSSYSWKEIFAKLVLLSWNKNTSDNLLSYLIVKYLLL